MGKFTFKDTDTIGHLITENELYEQYHYPEMPIRFDSNFIEFRRMPTLNEFKQTESFLRNFHSDHNQYHLRFYFADNAKPAGELLEYIINNNYDIGYMELYGIDPKQFPEVPENHDIQVEEVTDITLDDYLKLQYETDMEFGESFAKQKVDMNKRQFADKQYVQIIAYYHDAPAGTMNIYAGDKAVEIENLDVRDEFQRKGIGSQLQWFAMDRYQDSSIILIADGEDTPREMYQKQNYRYLSYKYELLKILK
ncbi:GNAT family N-acetyltransferase [Virgibacillus siamensis]|uniref:GNAT family N-acetyltransferase n=1 Tax=Virgibacillus siamensis TaxID=480071 RepID=UPI000984A580|nr:GNAT family N-acetyltransferase [Virgibacillus siamensis]